MTHAEQAELKRLRDAYIAAEKRCNDAVEAIERIRDELVIGRQALLILSDSSSIPPRAEEVIPLWRLPRGPVA